MIFYKFTIMKKNAITLFGFFFINFIYSQGITNICISPLNLKESDILILSVYQTFTS